MGKKQKTERLDEKDLKILKLLAKNSRLSLREIAKHSGLSASTVLNRIRKLESSGIIKRYTIEIDYEKLGYELTAVIGIIISKGKLREIEREVAEMRNVVSIYDVTGDLDAIIIAKFRSRREMSNFVKRLLSMEYVERTRTMVVLEPVKECSHIV